MPVVTKYATAVQAAGGVFNGSWTGAVSTVQSDNSVYATAAPGKNQEYASVFEVPFSTAEVPAGAIINSALVEIQVKCSTTSSIGIVTSSLFADSGQATAIGAVPGVQTPATEPTADTTFSFTRNPTEAQIRDLWVRVQGTRGNSNTALTWSLDFVRVTVNYTDPPTPVTGTGGVSFGISASGSGSVQLPSATGTGSVAFGFTAGGTGTVGLPAITGSGGVSFGFTLGGEADYTPPAVTGTGAVSFSAQTGGAGTFTLPSIAGSGGVTFGAVLEGTGASQHPGISGTGGMAFGFSITATGAFSAQTGISGSGAVAFGFTTAGTGFTTPPLNDDTGPWITHGTVHLGFKPHH